LEMAWRYLTIIRPQGSPEILGTGFNHDGAMLVAFLMICGTAGILWGQGTRSRGLAFLLALFCCVAVLASRRRAAVVAIDGGLLAIALVLLVRDWRRFVPAAVVAVFLGIGYLILFWNESNAIGEPARAVRTVLFPSSISERDMSSDLYREVEKRDVWSDIS